MQTTISRAEAEARDPVVPTGCCPPFDPSSWHEGEITWEDEPFVTSHVRALLHVPLDMGKRVTEAQALIDAAGAAPDRPLMLCDETSMFGTDLYIHVTRPVPGAHMTALSGRFLTHVYEGPYRDVKLWARDLVDRVRGQGKSVEKIYFAYTTCPACAKAYGKNYVVGFAKISEGAAQQA